MPPGVSAECPSGRCSSYSLISYPKALSSLYLRSVPLISYYYPGFLVAVSCWDDCTVFAYLSLLSRSVKSEVTSSASEVAMIKLRFLTEE